MHHLAYISSATRLFGERDLLLMLDQARSLNERSDITGLLLYRDGSFLQVLEGSEDAVRDTYARIRQDARHTRVNTLIDAAIPEREFPDWRMGFPALDDPECLARPDVSNFLKEPLTHDAFDREPSRIRRLLMIFKLKA